MMISTQTDSLSRHFGDTECVRILAKAGFDAIDWSQFALQNDDSVWNTDDWAAHADELLAAAKECGVVFNQSHAPFPSSRGEQPYDTVIRQRIVRSMEIAARLGAKNIVVHPVQHLEYKTHKKELFDMNLEFYRSLIPVCERLNIRVCLENMWQYDKLRGHIVDSVCSQPEEFCAMLDALDSPWMVGCLDIGHCALVGVDPAAFIRAMGAKRLQALHVHDVDHVRDCHTMPFLQKLDWGSITGALADIGYTGDFTFEADNYIEAFPDALRPEASALMAKVGRYLVSRIDAK